MSYFLIILFITVISAPFLYLLFKLPVKRRYKSFREFSDELYKDLDTETENLERIIKLSEEGDKKSQNDLVDLYFLGNLEWNDDTEQALIHAANDKHDGAQLALGIIYFSAGQDNYNNEKFKYYTKSAKWLKMAEWQGNLEAKKMLFDMTNDKGEFFDYINNKK